jgi:hypothetical protein
MHSVADNTGEVAVSSDIVHDDIHTNTLIRNRDNLYPTYSELEY